MTEYIPQKDSVPSQTPPCKHYKSCGGCSFQHVEKEYYYKMKQQRLFNILKDLGQGQDKVLDLIRVGEKTRRRVELKVAVFKGEVRIGFFARKSHEVVDVNDCLIMDDASLNMLPILKGSIAQFKKASVVKSIMLTNLDSGIDVLVSLNKKLHKNDYSILDELAKNANVTRLSIMLDGDANLNDVIYDSGGAKVSFGGVEVDVPVGAFLQATKKGQEAITSCVNIGLDGCRSVADIYSGCGTYSFSLLNQASHIAAYEGSEDMVQAMYNSIVKNGLEGVISSYVRDVYKRPLKSDVLSGFDGVVINPPRNGALPQVKELAKSDVKKIVMVSCNPNTFKRDAKCLLDGGYEMKSATAIDQFYWTDHLEVVAVFSRGN